MRVQLIPDPSDKAEFDRLTKRWGHVAFHLAESAARIGGDALRYSFFDNFSTEGGGQWKPLAPWTQAERQQQGYHPHHPILERTGTLHDSITVRSHPLHIEEVIWESKEHFTIALGTADTGTKNTNKYDLLHYGGINDEGYYVPPRPVMVLHSHQEGFVDDAMEKAAEIALGVLNG